MDSDINKENVSLDKNKQKVLFEYDPKYPIVTSTDNIDPTITEQEERAHSVVNKIRNDKERANRVNYPWESDEEIQDNIPPSANKKYEKKTYSVTPARIKEISGKDKADTTTYIIVNNYSEPPKDDPYGNGKFMPQQASNDISSGYDHAVHLYAKTKFGYNFRGWPFKYLPNTNDITTYTPEWIQQNIKKGMGDTDTRRRVSSRADKASRCRPIPGVRNGHLDNLLLQPIKATLNPGSKDSLNLYKNAAAAFNRMYDTALKDGVRIYVSSGYRNSAKQASLKSSEPGGVAKVSNHGWGKAIDVWPGGFPAQREYLQALANNNFSGLPFTRAQYEEPKQWINLNGDKFGWYWGDAWHESWHFTYMWD